MNNTLKWCADCQDYLPLIKFGKNKSRSDGLTTYCLSHHNVRSNKSRKGRGREYALSYKYGLNLESYAILFAEQRGACATCGTENVLLHVDHNHACCFGRRTCGKCVRGLLCFKCNNALGNVNDDPKILQTMIEYLRLAGTG